VLDAQVTNPYTGEILPFKNIGDYTVSPGNFNNYPANYGLLNHLGKLNALPFITIEKDISNPWLVILNGGPGRSNLRLSFELDSILKYYNVLIHGYRGIDDKTFEGYDNLDYDSLKMFVANHRKVFGSKNICDDIDMITNVLNIDTISILAHSFGTIISEEFGTDYRNRVDTIFAFSPVDSRKPYPSAKKLHLIIDSISIQLGYNSDVILKKIEKLSKGVTSSSYFYMGIISSFYTKENISNFITEIYENKLSYKDLENRGERFVNQKWLFDFGLKFCNLVPIDDKSDDVCDRIAKGFKAIVDQYVIDKGCPEKASNIDELPVKFYIPEYELFYCEIVNAEFVKCGCGHADLWKQAPKYIIYNR